MYTYIYIYIYIYTHPCIPQFELLELIPLIAIRQGRRRLFERRGGIVHYEYMTLAKKTSVLRETILLFFEPRCFGVNKNKLAP